ncbi:hypothetical protein LTR94_029354, partial [Friedmanniomyces endolithicus]
VPAAIEEAFHIAASGRPGPVLVDLPKDVQFATTSEDYGYPISNEAGRVDHDAIAQAEAAIRQASKPLIYIGGGVKIGHATDAVRAFADATGIPQVSTLNALGTIPTDGPDMLGMLGMHGTRAANEAVQESDLLIVVGARFDDRATGKLAEFAPNARIVHFDIDASEVGKLRTANVAVVGELKPGVEALTARIRSGQPLEIQAWKAECAKAAEASAYRYDAPGEGVYAPALLKEISEAAGDAFVAACDVGQHQ